MTAKTEEMKQCISLYESSQDEFWLDKLEEIIMEERGKKYD